MKISRETTSKHYYKFIEDFSKCVKSPDIFHWMCCFNYISRCFTVMFVVPRRFVTYFDLSGHWWCRNAFTLLPLPSQWHLWRLTFFHLYPCMSNICSPIIIISHHIIIIIIIISCHVSFPNLNLPYKHRIPVFALSSPQGTLSSTSRRRLLDTLLSKPSIKHGVTNDGSKGQ